MADDVEFVIHDERRAHMFAAGSGPGVGPVESRELEGSLLTMPNKPPERFLTDDEVVEFPVRGNDTPFRIRAWQGRNYCPFVVVSQVIRPDGMWPGPSHATLKLANFVHSAVLTYPSYPMMYQEDEYDENGVPTLTCYRFELHGSYHRRRLHKPSGQVRPWDFVEHVLRQKVERWA